MCVAQNYPNWGKHQPFHQFSTKLSKKMLKGLTKWILFFYLIIAFVRKTLLLVCNVQKIVDQPYLFNRVKVQIRPKIWDIETYKNNLENEIFQHFIIWIKHWTKYLLLLLFPSRCLPFSLQMQWSWDLQKWWIMPVWSWILRQWMFR